MRNPIIKDVGELRMLLLLHAFISCLPALYTALIPCLAAYILHLFSYFLALSSLHPSTFNGNVFTPLFHCFFVVYSLANALCVCASPTYFAACGHVKRT